MDKLRRGERYHRRSCIVLRTRSATRIRIGGGGDAFSSEKPLFRKGELQVPSDRFSTDAANERCTAR